METLGIRLSYEELHELRSELTAMSCQLVTPALPQTSKLPSCSVGKHRAATRKGVLLGR